MIGGSEFYADSPSTFVPASTVTIDNREDRGINRSYLNGGMLGTVRRRIPFNRYFSVSPKNPYSYEAIPD